MGVLSRMRSTPTSKSGARAGTVAAVAHGIPPLAGGGTPVGGHGGTFRLVAWVSAGSVLELLEEVGAGVLGLAVLAIPAVVLAVLLWGGEGVLDRWAEWKRRRRD